MRTAENRPVPTLMKLRQGCLRNKFISFAVFSDSVVTPKLLSCIISGSILLNKIYNFLTNLERTVSKIKTDIAALLSE